MLCLSVHDSAFHDGQEMHGALSQLELAFVPPDLVRDALGDPGKGQ